MSYDMLGMSLSDAALTLTIGVGGSLLWLMLLFSCKPKLELWVDEHDDGCVFFARNRGVARAVQVEGRLWMVTMTRPRHVYVEIPLNRQRLFTLNGQWQVARRPKRLADEGTYGPEFGFEPASDNLIEQLEHMNAGDGAEVLLLFQVWAQHGFTNFGRSTPAWFALDPRLGLLKRNVWQGAQSPLRTLITVSRLQLVQHSVRFVSALRERTHKVRKWLRARRTRT